jgi:DNA repair protein RadA/Sms
MAKVKTAFVCTDCGADYSKWQGQCTACKEWNTLSEMRGVSTPAHKSARGSRFEGFAGSLSAVQSLNDVSLAEQVRLSTGMAEFDRVLGGGLVEGSRC